MDDLKLFGKHYNQIDSLVQTVHFVSSDIGMEFGIKKCGLVILRSRKMVKVEGIGEKRKEKKVFDDEGYNLDSTWECWRLIRSSKGK